MREPWTFEDPSCRGIDTEVFYPETKTNPPELPIIRTICGGCIHRADCLEWAVHNERFGIWAGTTEADRRRIRANRNIILKEEEVA